MKTGKYKDTDSHMLSDCLQKLKNKPELLLKVGLIFVSVNLSLKKEEKKRHRKTSLSKPINESGITSVFPDPYLGHCSVC